MKMKKIIIALLAGIIMLSLNSCTRETEGYSIRDALKISAWVIDESIDPAEFYWEQPSYGGLHSNHYDEFISFERLKLNEPRISAPLGYYKNGIHSNLSIFFEFDGIIEVVSEDEFIRMSYNDKNPTQPGLNGGIPVEPIVSDTGGRATRQSISWSRELYVDILPLDKPINTTGLNVSYDAEIGRVYYLTVNAYRFEDANETPIIDSDAPVIMRTKSPVIRAELKFEMAEDTAMPAGRSRFLLMELISYEYSDIYRLLDEIWDDDYY